eukprot:scaffold82820_cov70-Phaeocystis_antarctica.AAC.3
MSCSAAQVGIRLRSYRRSARRLRPCLLTWAMSSSISPSAVETPRPSAGSWACAASPSSVTSPSPSFVPDPEGDAARGHGRRSTPHFQLTGSSETVDSITSPSSVASANERMLAGLGVRRVVTASTRDGHHASSSISQREQGDFSYPVWQASSRRRYSARPGTCATLPRSSRSGR